MSEMDSVRWARIGAVFNDVADLPAAERIAHLSKIGESDPELRRAVEDLLAADTDAERELERFDFGVPDLLLERAGPLVDVRDPLGIIGRIVSHFRVVDLVASGGMGVVYRAEDLHLGRTVALKFPLPHLELDSTTKDRFAREARSIGALEHPNLCTVYEAGESEQGLFLAMPLYSGQTLKDRLAVIAPFGVNDALRIAQQIASGLECAHDAGIVHRDLKPSNVMLLPDGTAKILDFGLAKIGDLTRTKSGVTLGTVSYMAPEQVRGVSVDRRADLWSLGVLMYEMLTGARPFSGEHEISIANAILNDDPRPLQSLRPELPREVQQLVQSLLQKDVRSRYQSATDVVTDIASVLAGGRAAFRVPPSRRTVAWVRKRRTPLALLLVVGMTVAVAAAIPRISSAINKPTDNPEAYRFFLAGREYERRGPKSSAESLYVKALALDSGFALARARLAVVYAACRQGGSRDCYRSSIEDRRLDHLEQIRTEAQHALRSAPRLADAHFALGLYWEQREEPARALAEFDLAQRGMRRSGELHAAIGRAYRAQGRWEDAIQELQRALAIDPEDVTSLAELATTYSRLRRYPESIRHHDRYLALVPDAYPAMIIRGNVYLRMTGSVDTLAAIVHRLPPEWRRRSLMTRLLVADIQGRPDDALRALDEAPLRLPEEQGFNVPALLRAQVYRNTGDSIRARVLFDSARVVLEAAIRERPNDYRRLLTLGLALAGLGRATEAIAAAQRAMTIMPPSRTVPAGTTTMRGAAEIYAQLPSHRHEAIALLDQLMQMPAGREASVPFLRVDPAWRPLRDDPAFQRLLAKYSNQ